MSFSFRPAIRENVGLLIGLAGGTGSGKTYSAMRLAQGIASDKPFCVIDTEAGRAKHYADQFQFDHGDLEPPFTPARYAEAIAAADAAGYPVIVVDSMSHEHAGEGGLLDWHDKEFERMGGRDAVKMAAWIKPKMAHKAMVQRLLQVRAHLILCFRAEEKVEIVRVDGKTKIVPKESPTGLHGWMPISEKNLPYELTASFLLTADAPGIPKPIKLQAQHRELFPLDKPITEDSGRKLAEWASGGQPKAAAQAPESVRTGNDDDAPPSSASLAPPVAAAPTELVGTSTGEITEKPAGGAVMLRMPGDNREDDIPCGSPEEWIAAFEALADKVVVSSKLSPSTKRAKLDALKVANDGTMKRLGATAIARVNGLMTKGRAALAVQQAEVDAREREET